MSCVDYFKIIIHIAICTFIINNNKSIIIWIIIKNIYNLTEINIWIYNKYYKKMLKCIVVVF